MCYRKCFLLTLSLSLALFLLLCCRYVHWHYHCCRCYFCLCWCEHEWTSKKSKCLLLSTKTYTDKDRFSKPTLYRKQQWVKRWKTNITMSVTRARKDSTSSTKKIYNYFNCTGKPITKVNNHRIRTHKRKYEQKRASRPLERTLDTFTNTTTRTLRSTSKPPPEKPPTRHTNPTIDTFFTKKIDDRYPDEWND